MVLVEDTLSWRNLLFAFAVVLFWFYKRISSHGNYFEKLNIAHDRTSFFQTWKGMMQMPMFDLLAQTYMANKGHQFFGVFEVLKPITMITSPELIKRITITDFDHFSDHQLFVNPKIDKLFGNSVFAMNGEKWKRMRKTVSPIFTSGKMRQIFQYITECCHIATNHYRQQMESNSDLEVDIKDLFTRFTADAMGISILGVRINSMLEKDNEFFALTLKATHFTNWQYVKIFLFSNFYGIMKFLNVRVFDAKFSKYFHTMVWETIERRMKEDVSLPDLINILVELRKQWDNTTADGTHSTIWTEDELVAQCFIFFTAGFETTSVTMGFMAHELMENPDIQAKLVAEIDYYRQELAGEPLNYDTLKKMKYMDMVVNETLRKWPPLPFIEKTCSKPYILTDDDGQRLKLNVGDKIVLPVSGLQRDPSYFPHPKKFDPERFSNENKMNIVPYTFIPFGTGPRYCIGSRYAILQIKAIMFHLLSEFTFEPSPKTAIPISLVKSSFQVEPKAGFWMHFRPRN